MRTVGTLILMAAIASAAEPGFTPLFDGRTLKGWFLAERPAGKDGKPSRGYIVENGAIVCPADGGGNLLTEKEYANFVLRFEFQMEPGGNNGIGIRTPKEGNPAYAGMEIQILDHRHERYAGKLKPTQHHGSIYDVIPAQGDALRPAGQWNEQEIVVDGTRIRVTLNGKVITNADISTITDPEILKRHPGLRRVTGHIGFLGHGSLVSFRNIRLQELPARP
jgi:hypothetical protein